MRVMISSHWHPNSNGTEYTEVLGLYPDLRAAEADGYEYAMNKYEEPSEEEQDESGFDDEGPDVVLEEYDPEKHDGHEAGGNGSGSGFKAEFERLERLERETFFQHSEK